MANCTLMRPWSLGWVRCVHMRGHEETTFGPWGQRFRLRAPLPMESGALFVVRYISGEDIFEDFRLKGIARGGGKGFLPAVRSGVIWTMRIWLWKRVCELVLTGWIGNKRLRMHQKWRYLLCNQSACKKIFASLPHASSVLFNPTNGCLQTY